MGGEAARRRRYCRSRARLAAENQHIPPLPAVKKGSDNLCVVISPADDLRPSRADVLGKSITMGPHSQRAADACHKDLLSDLRSDPRRTHRAHAAAVRSTASGSRRPAHLRLTLQCLRHREASAVAVDGKR